MIEMKRLTLLPVLLLLLLLTLLATGCAAEAPPPCTAEQSYCVTCHSDKDMLIATADPEEAEVASEESGEG